MTAKQYIEALGAELSRARGRGLLLSPADAALALAWHAAGVPVAQVIAELREAARRTAPRGARRGAVATGVSLQLIAPALASRARPTARKGAAQGSLRGHLRAAAQAKGLAARAAWEAVADAADDLLAGGGGEAYWTAAVGALLRALREVPRPRALLAGAALRERLAPRPRGMSRSLYRRSLQLMLLSAASERLGLPPRAFLLQEP